MVRDDFSPKVVEALAKRVGQRCSYCGLATSGPHDGPAKWVNVGVGAHITAAAVGGPRYDPSLTPDQRCAADNGIWLCQTHSRLIDVDVQRFTVELLRRLKSEAEERIRQEIDGKGNATWSKPIFAIPYPRNPYFTGREDVLENLATELKAGGKAALGQVAARKLPQLNRAAISGLGGIGKTQIAIEFAYRHRDEYRAVYFARAETESDLIYGFVAIARELGLPQANEQDQNLAVQAARQWLNDNESWLLILDNADKPSLLAPFLPADCRGHVIVTSRAPSFAELHIANPQRLQEPPDAEALAFLLERTNRADTDTSEKQAAAELASLLGNLPLALEQAGAYLVAHQATFSAYLESYRRRGLELLSIGKPEIAGHPDPVATTWSLNFQKVERTSRASADVLNAAAFLAPDGIPDELFIEGGAEISPAVAAALASGDPLAVDELLAPLVRYSLIQREAPSRTFSVHRLVQEVLRNGLGSARGEKLERVVKALNRAFPWPVFETWPRCERLLAHLFAVAVASEDNVELARLLHSAGSYLDDRARYAEAEPAYQHSLAICEKILGEQHLQVARSLNNLANLYLHQGRLDDAEPLYRRSLDIRQKALDDQHPEVAQTINNLAILYRNQGRLPEAEPLFRRSLDIREKVLGDQHPDVATALNNLANLYQDQSLLDDAEPLFRRALAIYEKALGNQHPLVATALNNLAILHRNQGRLDDAEPLYRRSLDIREKALGDQHPDVGSALNNLANLYVNQGRLDEAEPLFRRSLDIREKALGEQHPDVATSLNNLASLYLKQDRLADAEPLIRRSLDTWEKTLGEQHPDVATSLNNLAVLYVDQGRLDEAEPLFRRSLAIREKALGDQHPLVVTSLENLAKLLRLTNRDAVAAELERQAAEVRARHAARNRTGP